MSLPGSGPWCMIRASEEVRDVCRRGSLLTCATVTTTRLPRSGIAVEIGRPVVYQAAPALEQITARVGCLGGGGCTVWASAASTTPRGVRSSGPRPSPGSSTGTHAARRRCRVP